MRIRVIGAGFYGCHIASALKRDGHDVEVHEIRKEIFGGASGGIPARLHKGFHYPRSRMTRAACLEHEAEFMAAYGHLTRAVPINIYAIASDHSLVDYDQYVRTLEHEVEFIQIRPEEFGLRDVEGAVLTGERHIVTRLAKAHFEEVLGDSILLEMSAAKVDDPLWDLTVDCTFCANDSAGVDRYEPCLVLLMKGRTDKAVTIMDGPFGSLYPWDEDHGLCSLSSARWTPFSKDCKTYAEAKRILGTLTDEEIFHQANDMIESMRRFYPEIDDYRHVDSLLSVRAMPLSGADTRLVDVIRVGEKALRVRAGKIDAILHAERMVKEFIR